MSDEPILTYVMPIYTIASWYGLYIHGNTGKHLLPISASGWCWAAVNMATRGFDLGIVTFALVVLSCIWERSYGFTKQVKSALTLSCLLVSINYALPLVLWDTIANELAQLKSQLWLKIFWGYCASMTVFWSCAVFKNQGRIEISSPLTSVTYGSLPQ
jgi:hypothetical protein